MIHSTLFLVIYILITVTGTLLTLIVKKIYLKIIGVLLIAIGLVMSSISLENDFKNVTKNQDHSKDTILQTINQFRFEILNAKNSSVNDSLKIIKMNEIERNFNDWAVKVKESVDEKVFKKMIEYNINHAKINENEYDLNKSYHSLYYFFYLSVYNHIEAYNANNEEKINFYTSSAIFPNDIFSDDFCNYWAYIEFSKNYYLAFYFLVPDKILPDAEVPAINIIFFDHKPYKFEPNFERLLIFPKIISNNFKIEAFEDCIFNSCSLGNLEDYFNDKMLEDHHKIFDNLIESLFEEMLFISRFANKIHQVP
jgi:hypothetical protein